MFECEPFPGNPTRSGPLPDSRCRIRLSAVVQRARCPWLLTRRYSVGHDVNDCFPRAAEGAALLTCVTQMDQKRGNKYKIIRNRLATTPTASLLQRVRKRPFSRTNKTANTSFRW